MSLVFVIEAFSGNCYEEFEQNVVGVEQTKWDTWRTIAKFLPCLKDGYDIIYDVTAWKLGSLKPEATYRVRQGAKWLNYRLDQNSEWSEDQQGVELTAQFCREVHQAWRANNGCASYKDR